MADSYSPKWAPHVSGSWTLTYEDDGTPEPCVVLMTCATCGATHRTTCRSGMPRQWVLRFATAHAHRDPLRDPFPKKGTP